MSVTVETLETAIEWLTERIIQLSGDIVRFEENAKIAKGMIAICNIEINQYSEKMMELLELENKEKEKNE